MTLTMHRRPMKICTRLILLKKKNPTHDSDAHLKATALVDGWITSRVHLFVFSCDQKKKNKIIEPLREPRAESEAAD